MNAVFLMLLLSQNALCDSNSQTMSLSAYQDCIQTVRLDRVETYHESIVGPALSNMSERIRVLEVLMGAGGLGGAGAIGRRKYKQRKDKKKNGDDE